MSMSVAEQQSRDIKRRSRNEQTGRDFKCQNEYSRADPTTEIYLKSEGRGGGPNEPLLGFEEIFLDLQQRQFISQQIPSAKDHPLHEILAKYSQSLTPGGDLEEQVIDDSIPGQNENTAQIQESKPIIKKQNFKQISIHIAQMSEEWRVMLSSDEIFGLYLRDVASKTNQLFYKNMLRFIMLYRECLNENGWQKLAESQCREAKQTLEERNITARMATFKDVMYIHEFCSINNSEVAPEICNEFVTTFLEMRKDCGLEKLEAIDYTRNFCHWLFINGHTCSKLSMIT
ncbi:UNKNOWN [Stylonychia lemnae]|uniref:Uncharacterized protein n=1 Tax=Stylonychia lemnae TaxID=5949 RepID=A0A078A512_STYLE|nr:UNKNOWN [Stylonychia lemnae]|eukprot:CDW77355.1 UNKNOWN [Stylonychia lemnae]